ATYLAKVSGEVVPVRIREEKWKGDKHTGWVGVNTLTGRSVYIKSAQRLRTQVGGDAPQGAAPAPKATKAAPRTPAVAPDALDVGPTGAIPEGGEVLARAASPVPPKPTSGRSKAKGKPAGK